MLPNLVPVASGCVPASYAFVVLWAGWDAVARWWDGVELWLTQLGLALQVTLLMVVLLPACWGAARLLDRVVGFLFDQLGFSYRAEDAKGPQ